jgi:regulatory protein
VSAHILRIEDVGPERKARRLVFDDGSDPRLTSLAAVRKLGLEEGAEVCPQQLDDALTEVEEPLARERALRLLGYRDRSRAELTRKLSDSGYPDDLARRISDRFLQVGLVDDERFAAAWTRSRRAARIGPRRIERELLAKDIDPEIIADALATECPDDSQVDQAIQALRGAVARSAKQRDTLIRRLVAKGHALPVAVQAVDTASSRAGDIRQP